MFAIQLVGPDHVAVAFIDGSFVIMDSRLEKIFSDTETKQPAVTEYTLDSITLFANYFRSLLWCDLFHGREKNTFKCLMIVKKTKDTILRCVHIKRNMSGEECLFSFTTLDADMLKSFQFSGYSLDARRALLHALGWQSHA